jgi:hypothetical protein
MIIERLAGECVPKTADVVITSAALMVQTSRKPTRVGHRRYSSVSHLSVSIAFALISIQSNKLARHTFRIVNPP